MLEFYIELRVGNVAARRHIEIMQRHRIAQAGAFADVANAGLFRDRLASLGFHPLTLKSEQKRIAIENLTGALCEAKPGLPKTAAKLLARTMIEDGQVKIDGGRARYVITDPDAEFEEDRVKEISISDGAKRWAGTAESDELVPAPVSGPGVLRDNMGGRSRNSQMKIEDMSPANAKLLFLAAVSAVAASTATAEPISLALPSVGDILTLDRGLASSVVIKDSTPGTPRSCRMGTDRKSVV